MEIIQANNTAQFLVSVLTICGVFIGFIAWHIRNEMRIKALEKYNNDQEKMDKILWGKLDALQSSVNELLIQFGRMDERLKKHE